MAETSEAKEGVMDFNLTETLEKHAGRLDTLVKSVTAAVDAAQEAAIVRALAKLQLEISTMLDLVVTPP